MFSSFKKLRSLTSSSEELIQGIDRHELNASGSVDLFLPDLTDDFFHDSVGSAVAVVVRILEHLAPFSQQGIASSTSTPAGRWGSP